MFVWIARLIGLQYSFSGSGIIAASSSFQRLFTAAAWSFPMAVSSASAGQMEI
jgi:hypothetical protein